ncbi:hypothetical protein GDO86_004200 [Hymenochirus boettgeri]|uniref:Uncharacterized protein n=1 Tax=Hymenochirus boettgeri TaxID=247094 RepID=A0A8T2KCG1_9PIPI|nr:hypothetical protein GDO86_004200 [Hymenochirus boettgeri]
MIPGALFPLPVVNADCALMLPDKLLTLLVVVTQLEFIFTPHRLETALFGKLVLPGVGVMPGLALDLGVLCCIDTAGGRATEGIAVTE